MARTFESSAYSFGDVTVAVTGPNITTTITGVAEEGITVEYEGDAATLTMGADGSGMYSDRVAQNGTVTLRILKASPFNKVLADAFYFQRGSTVNGGRNLIVISNGVTGDIVTAQACGFRRMPNLTFAVEGGMNEWVFLSQRITSNLGPGVSFAVNG